MSSSPRELVHSNRKECARLLADRPPGITSLDEIREVCDVPRYMGNGLMVEVLGEAPFFSSVLRDGTVSPVLSYARELLVVKGCWAAGLFTVFFVYLATFNRYVGMCIHLT